MDSGQVLPESEEMSGGDSKMDEGFIKNCDETLKSTDVTDDVINRLSQLWIILREHRDDLENPDRCLESLLISTARLIFNAKYAVSKNSKPKENLQASIESCAEAFIDVPHRRSICAGVATLVRKPWKSKAFDTVITKGAKSVTQVTPEAAKALITTEGWIMLEIRADYLTMVGTKAIDRFRSLLHVLVTHGHTIHQIDSQSTTKAEETPDEYQYDPFKFPRSKYLKYLEVYALLSYEKYIEEDVLSKWSAPLILMVIENLLKYEKNEGAAKTRLFPSLYCWNDIGKVSTYLAKLGTWAALKSETAVMLEHLYSKWTSLSKKELEQAKEEGTNVLKSPLSEIIEKESEIHSTEIMYRLASSVLRNNPDLQTLTDVREALLILYLRALSKDINYRETLKTDDPEDVTKERENLERRLSTRYLEFAVFIKEFPGFVKECLLTAFSLNPCLQLFDCLFPGKCETEVENSVIYDAAMLEQVKKVDISSPNLRNIADKDSWIPEVLVDDLELLHNPRYKGFVRWATADTIERLCRKLLENKGVTAIDNRSLEWVKPDYEKYKDLKPQYDPEDDGLEKGYRWGSSRRIKTETSCRAKNAVQRAKQCLKSDTRSDTNNRKQSPHKRINGMSRKGRPPKIQNQSQSNFTNEVQEVTYRNFPNFTLTENPWFSSSNDSGVESILNASDNFRAGRIYQTFLNPENSKSSKTKAGNAEFSNIVRTHLSSINTASQIPGTSNSGDLSFNQSKGANQVQALGEDRPISKTEDFPVVHNVLGDSINNTSAIGLLPCWDPSSMDDCFPPDAYHADLISLLTTVTYAKSKFEGIADSRTRMHVAPGSSSNVIVKQEGSQKKGRARSKSVNAETEIGAQKPVKRPRLMNRKRKLEEDSLPKEEGNALVKTDQGVDQLEDSLPKEEGNAIVQTDQGVDQLEENAPSEPPDKSQNLGAVLPADAKREDESQSKPDCNPPEPPKPDAVECGAFTILTVSKNKAEDQRMSSSHSSSKSSNQANELQPHMMAGDIGSAFVFSPAIERTITSSTNFPPSKQNVTSFSVDQSAGFSPFNPTSPHKSVLSGNSNTITVTTPKPSLKQYGKKRKLVVLRKTFDDYYSSSTSSGEGAITNSTQHHSQPKSNDEGHDSSNSSARLENSFESNTLLKLPSSCNTESSRVVDVIGEACNVIKENEASALVDPNIVAVIPDTPAISQSLAFGPPTSFTLDVHEGETNIDANVLGKSLPAQEEKTQPTTTISTPAEPPRKKPSFTVSIGLTNFLKRDPTLKHGQNDSYNETMELSPNISASPACFNKSEDVASTKKTETVTSSTAPTELTQKNWDTIPETEKALKSEGEKVSEIQTHTPSENPTTNLIASDEGQSLNKIELSCPSEDSSISRDFSESSDETARGRTLPEDQNRQPLYLSPNVRPVSFQNTEIKMIKTFSSKKDEKESESQSDLATATVFAFSEEPTTKEKDENVTSVCDGLELEHEKTISDHLEESQSSMTLIGENTENSSSESCPDPANAPSVQSVGKETDAHTTAVDSEAIVMAENRETIPDSNSMAGDENDAPREILMDNPTSSKSESVSPPPTFPSLPDSKSDTETRQTSEIEIITVEDESSEIENCDDHAEENYPVPEENIPEKGPYDNLDGEAENADNFRTAATDDECTDLACRCKTLPPPVSESEVVVSRPLTPVQEIEDIINNQLNKRTRRRFKYDEDTEKGIKLHPSVLEHIRNYRDRIPGKRFRSVLCCFTPLARLPLEQLPQKARSQIISVMPSKRSSRLKEKKYGRMEVIQRILRSGNKSESDGGESEEDEDEEESKKSVKSLSRSSSPEIEVIYEGPTQRPGPKSKKKPATVVPVQTPSPKSSPTKPSNPKALLISCLNEVKGREEEQKPRVTARKRGTGRPRREWELTHEELEIANDVVKKTTGDSSPTRRETLRNFAKDKTPTRDSNEGESSSGESLDDIVDDPDFFPHDEEDDLGPEDPNPKDTLVYPEIDFTPANDPDEVNLTEDDPLALDEMPVSSGNNGLNGIEPHIMLCDSEDISHDNVEEDRAPYVEETVQVTNLASTFEELSVLPHPAAVNLDTQRDNNDDKRDDSDSDIEILAECAPSPMNLYSCVKTSDRQANRRRTRCSEESSPKRPRIEVTQDENNCTSRTVLAQSSGETASAAGSHQTLSCGAQVSSAEDLIVPDSISDERLPHSNDLHDIIVLQENKNIDRDVDAILPDVDVAFTENPVCESILPDDDVDDDVLSDGTVAEKDVTEEIPDINSPLSVNEDSEFHPCVSVNSRTEIGASDVMAVEDGREDAVETTVQENLGLPSSSEVVDITGDITILDQDLEVPDQAIPPSSSISPSENASALIFQPTPVNDSSSTDECHPVNEVTLVEDSETPEESEPLSLTVEEESEDVTMTEQPSLPSKRLDESQSLEEESGCPNENMSFEESGMFQEETLAEEEKAESPSPSHSPAAIEPSPSSKQNEESCPAVEDPTVDTNEERVCLKETLLVEDEPVSLEGGSTNMEVEDRPLTLEESVDVTMSEQPSSPSKTLEESVEEESDCPNEEPEMFQEDMEEKTESSSPEETLPQSLHSIEHNPSSKECEEASFPVAKDSALDEPEPRSPPANVSGSDFLYEREPQSPSPSEPELMLLPTEPRLALPDEPDYKAPSEVDDTEDEESPNESADEVSPCFSPLGGFDSSTEERPTDNEVTNTVREEIEDPPVIMETDAVNFEVQETPSYLNELEESSHNSNPVAEENAHLLRSSSPELPLLTPESVAYERLDYSEDDAPPPLSPLSVAI